MNVKKAEDCSYVEQSSFYVSENGTGYTFARKNTIPECGTSMRERPAGRTPHAVSTPVQSVTV